MRIMENSLIENISNNASKYDDSRDNLKERFIDVCNKENELGKIYTDDWEGYKEIFVSKEECSKSFIKTKILGCN